MGAGASSLPTSLDKETAKAYAGTNWDEAAFDAAANADGMVSMQDVLKVAAAKKPTTHGVSEPWLRLIASADLFLDELEAAAKPPSSDGQAVRTRFTRMLKRGMLEIEEEEDSDSEGDGGVLREITLPSTPTIGLLLADAVHAAANVAGDRCALGPETSGTSERLLMPS